MSSCFFPFVICGFIYRSQSHSSLTIVESFLFDLYTFFLFRSILSFHIHKLTQLREACDFAGKNLHSRKISKKITYVIQSKNQTTTTAARKKYSEISREDFCCWFKNLFNFFFFFFDVDPIYLVVFLCHYTLTIHGKNFW